MILVVEILAKFELSQSKYSLIERIGRLEAGDLDGLDKILEEWDVHYAKEVLDEISKRLRVVEEIRSVVAKQKADEVLELQPLFKQALWVFGPEFESIEYTSNQTMNTVIRKLFGDPQKGSLSRPDFVITPKSSSVGFYARPSYGDDNHENGIGSLVIVELKAPQVPLGQEEKQQPWRYFKELSLKGLIDANTQVHAYVLGSSIEAGENQGEQKGENYKMSPMPYDNFLIRAESRLLNLRNKIKEAPFMKSYLQKQVMESSTPLLKAG
jgi:hypothetical protein